MFAMKLITLHDLHRQLRRVIALNFDDLYYISAEVVKVNSSRGHRYIELVEKDASGNQLKAKTTAIIWRNVYESMLSEHGELLEKVLKPGLEIAFRAEVKYHEVYGLKLHIHSIDPTFTLGKESQRRMEILQRLKKENKLDSNSKVHLPRAIQKIAVISSETAAGYVDFLETLNASAANINYDIHLFQASMQGNNTEKEVCQKLSEIDKESGFYDLLVIVRGGGGSMDLRYFDNYKIALRIAECKLPIWSGIGHAIDQTIVDLVAHTSLKTPTAVAQHIDSYNSQFLMKLAEIKREVSEITKSRLHSEKSYLQQIRQNLSYTSKSVIDKGLNEIHRVREKIRIYSHQRIASLSNELEQNKQRVKDLNPSLVLQRGFVALEQKDRRIHKKSKFDNQESFEITFSDGTESVHRKEKTKK